MNSGPTGLWWERYKLKLMDDSRIFCFISVVRFRICEMRGVSSDRMVAEGKYRKKVGRDFCTRASN